MMMSVTKRNLLALIGGIALIGIAAPTSAYAQQGRGQDKSAEKRQDEKKEKKDGHTHAKIGAQAPAFTLTDTDGKSHTLADLKGKVVVLEWFNPGCPFVVKHHEHNTTMRDLAAKYKSQDVVWFAVNSGAPGLQGAGKDLNAEFKTKWNIAYPILLDENGKVGHSYGAKTTPHMYVINREGVLVYAGAIDNDNSARKLGSINYVDQALTQVLAGETVSTPESKPYGCAVKYGKKQ